MVRFLSGTVIGCMLLASLTASAAKQTTLADVVRDRSVLSAYDGTSPAEVMQAYLSGSKSASTSLVQKKQFTDKRGRVFTVFEQYINGLRVEGSYAKVAMDKGEVIQIINKVSPADNTPSSSGITPQDALAIAIAENFLIKSSTPTVTGVVGNITVFENTAFFYVAPTVEQIIIADANKFHGGFLVKVWSNNSNMLYHTTVSGQGVITSNQLRTANDNYRIFPVDPATTAQIIVDGANNGNAQSPIGWLNGAQNSQLIQGNNVRAYLDAIENDAPDGGGVSVVDDNFLSTANLFQDPSTAANRNVAVQNLFYLNNVIHDRLYEHGFTESVGNFQESNFGNGGSGSDSVNAEAQDGGGTNNANFTTPSDGINPRMQMYLWNHSSPLRDGDLDSDIVWHEYGHGLSWRMIGNMSGTVSRAIGEGLSDILALVVNNDDRVGEYSRNNINGVRSIRYRLHPATLADFNSASSVHTNGEILGAIGWDLWTIYQQNGLTDDDYLDDFVGAMNFITPDPDYLDVRDGLLAQVSTERACLIWEAFAARGAGEGAVFSLSSIIESFSMPNGCGAVIGGGLDGNEFACSNQAVTYVLDNPENHTVTWEKSINLQLQSSSNTSVTVLAISGYREPGYIAANFAGQQVLKDIWVGRPASPTASPVGPTTVRYGAIARYNYFGAAIAGATSFEWWLPHVFLPNATVTVDPQNWGVLYGSGSTSQVDALVGPNNGLVQVMGVNECGLGGARTLSVTVSTTGGGGNMP